MGVDTCDIVITRQQSRPPKDGGWGVQSCRVDVEKKKVVSSLGEWIEERRKGNPMTR